MEKEKGSIFEPLLILIGLSIILVFFILPQHGALGPAQGFSRITNPNTYQQYAESQHTSGPVLTTTSAYASLITLGSGNAAYATDPFGEYFTIENGGASPINLTGWKITNNKANRPYYVGNQQVTYPSDEVKIPQAVGYLSPSNFDLMQNIVLQPGDTAIVTTGTTGVQTPYKIVSFKENECSGYIESLPQYDFTPSLSNSCVPPSQEPGIENLDSACKTFIGGISACQTPTFGKVDQSSSDNCSDCINGRPAPSSVCFNFIQAHYSYPGCINYHVNDAHFYGTTWRIFLGQKWELWGKDTEVISLFDQFGKLAAYKAY